MSRVLAPSSNAVSSLRAPRGLPLTWRLVAVADGAAAIAESTDGITSHDLGDSYMRRFDRPYTAPAEAGAYRAIWADGWREVFETVVVAGDASSSFATAADVAARLGRALTADETTSVEFLLNMATAMVADAAGKDDGWAITLDPVPQVLRGLTVELTVRALGNPNQLASLREQLGNYSMSATFSPERTGLTLSSTEVLIVRRAVYGRTTVSVPVRSSFLAADRILLWQQAQPTQRTM